MEVSAVFYFFLSWFLLQSIHHSTHIIWILVAKMGFQSLKVLWETFIHYASYWATDLALRQVDVTDFTGYIEPVMVILHERELTWAGRVSWKHHTCMISALSISTTLRQHPLIWSATVRSCIFNGNRWLYTGNFTYKERLS